jgi:GT2 family glycosyltransferase/glycosyltransferase involved in cell wall biosynthesis
MLGPDRARVALERVAPPGSRARASFSVGKSGLREFVGFASRTRWRWRRARLPGGAEPAYAAWLEHHRLSEVGLREQRSRVRKGAMRVGVDCVVVPAGSNSDLARTLRSLTAQTLADWSARVVGHVSAVSSLDTRITSSDRNETGVLEDAVGAGDPDDFVLVLEAGDVLEPELLFQIAANGWDDPAVDMVHWDDDLIDQTGMLRDPRFRPAWSPDTLLSANYLGRSFAVRRRRLQAHGGFPPGGRDTRSWDLLLGLDLTEAQVARVPRILQHVRARPEPSPARAVEVVGRHLAESGRRAEVGSEHGAIRVRWPLDAPPEVTIVIPTTNRETLLRRCLDGLERTRYPNFGVVTVDSGGRDADAEAFYRQRAMDGLRIEPVWWEGPFNYSAANNLGARAVEGDVLVFLNDDTYASDPDWLAEMVGWVAQPGIGLVGRQLTGPRGLIQHGGAVVGMNGFAGHLFAGMSPGEDSVLGSTSWYRNCLSVTAACVAIDRKLFDRIGGFDERLVLCGSDVVLGLDARFQGRRNVCLPSGGVVHFEAQSRGDAVPRKDLFSSYWHYQRWLRGGDPYYSPNLSLQDGRPRLRAGEEPGATEVVGQALGRDLSVYRQTSDEEAASSLVKACRADRSLRGRVEAANRAPSRVRSVNWFLPDIDNPFYGGINTALRIADHLAREHEVVNQFVLLAPPNEPYVRSAIEAAFPALEGCGIAFSDGRVGPDLQNMPAADASIATQWHTAYMVANFSHTRRRFYLIQDFEPLFFPAGSNYALAEETYRLGLFGICNTEHMLDLYRNRYGGDGASFSPAVDQSVFHAVGRNVLDADAPVTVFTYARPGHWRNCWELASLALRTLKGRLGDRVRIVTAGSWARPDDLGHGIAHLGLLDYRETGDLYRRCDVGLALTVSEHPSYLPLELLACGVPVVAFDNPAGDWILHHEHNCLRTPRTVDGVVEGLERVVTDSALRARLAAQGLLDIAARHSDWDGALADVYGYLCDPVPVITGRASTR